LHDSTTVELLHVNSHQDAWPAAMYE